jgi:hypothetical protein
MRAYLLPWQYRPWRERVDRWRFSVWFLITAGSEPRCFPSAEVVAMFVVVNGILLPKPRRASFMVDSPQLGVWPFLNAK